MNAEPIAAVHALRDRGVDNGEELLAYGTPEQILTACHRWDSRKGVGPGLLARWIRNSDFTDPEPAPKQSKTAQLQARFAEYATRYPVGSIAEPHARMTLRCWPDDEELCPGQMIVIEAIYPSLTLRCDRCDFTAAIPARALHVLPHHQEATS